MQLRRELTLKLWRERQAALPLALINHYAIKGNSMELLLSNGQFINSEKGFYSTFITLTQFIEVGPITLNLLSQGLEEEEAMLAVVFR